MAKPELIELHYPIIKKLARVFKLIRNRDIWRNNALIYLIVETVSLVFTGDISFSDPVRTDVHRNFYCYKDTLSHVAHYVRDADISFANLESPIVPKKSLENKNVGPKVIFLYAEKQSVSALR